MNQKGDGSFFFLLGENSGIHQEAKQTTRYGSSDWAGPQTSFANQDLTLGPIPKACTQGSGTKSRKTCFLLYFYTYTIGLSFGLYQDYSDSEEVEL